MSMEDSERGRSLGQVELSGNTMPIINDNDAGRCRVAVHGSDQLS